MSGSVLVLLNRSAGTGHAGSLSDHLAEAIREGYGAPLDVSTKVLDDHPGVRSAAAAFVTSAPGRIFLRDGYSAGVMRLIYDQPVHPSLLDRVFYGYPLHRAVRDRLGILERRIEKELHKRLDTGEKVTIFTAPSGFAYDLMRPLKRLVASDPGFAGRVVMVGRRPGPSRSAGP